MYTERMDSLGQDIYAEFSPLSATGSTPILETQYAANHGVQVGKTGAPTTVKGILWGSKKQSAQYPADFDALTAEIDLSTITQFDVINKRCAAIVFQLTQLAGGSAPTVTVFYVGQRG